MASADVLVAQLQAQRLHWCQVDPADPDGPAVQIDTPSQYAAMGLVQCLRSGDGDGAIERLCVLARGWRGVTQAQLLGAAVGSADPAPFHADLLRPLLQDRPEWVSELAIKAMDLSRQARERVQGVQGN